MDFKKYEQEDGSYVDDDGCHYDDLAEFIQTGVFGFCGCGDNEANLELIGKGLEHIDSMHPDGVDFDDWWHKWKDAGVAICGNESSKQFFFYWCDKEGLTEHGGCIPGWLTAKGKSVLSALKSIEKGATDENV